MPQNSDARASRPSVNTPDPTDPPDKPTEQSTTSAAAAKPPRAEPVSSVTDFLRLFYRGKAKVLTDKIRKKVQAQPFVALDLRAGLVAEAVGNDPYLEKSKRLLMATATLDSYHGLDKSIQQFARDVAMVHPLASNIMTSEWFPERGATASVSLIDVWNAAEGQLKALSAALSKKELSSKRKGLRNVVYVVATWRLLVTGESLIRICRDLNKTVFAAPPRASKPHRVLEFLVEIDERQSKRIGSVLTWVSDIEADEIARSGDIRRDLERLGKQNQEKESEIVRYEQEVQKLRGSLASLRVDVETTKESSLVQGVHLRDDLLRQRGRYLRTLEEEIPLLQDCMTALDRDPPKLQAAKQNVSTVLDKLVRELKALKGD